jgi:ankyrin repeat protein
MANNGIKSEAAPQLTPEVIAFATKMYDAARAGQVDTFEQALPAGLPANMTNDKGDSLVCFFLFWVFFTRLKLMAQMGFTRLICAVNNHVKPSLLQPLYNYKFISWYFQVMLAAYHGHAPLVKLLIQHGANPNSLNDRGQSPLAGAVFKKEDKVIEVGLNLLAYGRKWLRSLRLYLKVEQIRTMERLVRWIALLCSSKKSNGRKSLQMLLGEEKLCRSKSGLSLQNQFQSLTSAEWLKHTIVKLCQSGSHWAVECWLGCRFDHTRKWPIAAQPSLSPMHHP